MRHLLIIIGLVCIAVPSSLLATEVKGLRMWPAPDNTRLVFDLSAPVEHSVFTLHNPERIVIDLKKTRVSGALPSVAYNEKRLKAVRYARRGSDGLRVVLDLKKQVSPKSFILKPHSNYGHRLVIDLLDDVAGKSAIKKSINYANKRTSQARDLVIAIDAGHGGEDPGAIGYRGTREKVVVLGIARELEKLIRRQRGMKAVMVRTGDYYIGLKERVEKARRAQADLFISIHADAFKNKKAHGSSVFILSDRGASSDVAKFLAESENNADLIGGVSLDDKDDLLKMVLVDMVKNSTIEDSHQVASQVLSGLKGVNRLHKTSVEQAGFRVLKAPDIPSILIETAFISNPKEERKLRSKRHQKALARAIFNGTRKYFAMNPIPGTLLAMKDRKHRISRGDTLSTIAEKYRVSVSLLRNVNNLRSDRLHIGKMLSIPAI